MAKGSGPTLERPNLTALASESGFIDARAKHSRNPKLAIHMSPDQYRAIRREAIASDTSMAKIIRRCIDAYFNPTSAVEVTSNDQSRR